MLKIQSIKVGESATNCYLIWDDKSKDGVIVDPGDSADYIERVIADLHICPIKIILTHGHWDHTLASLELSLAYQIPILMSKADAFLLAKLRPSPKIGIVVEDGDYVVVDKSKMKIIATPGHTPGSISFYAKKEKFIVVGDICFADGTFGRTDFGYSDKKNLSLSLAKVKNLPADTEIYPGHGESFFVSELVIDPKSAPLYR